MRRLFTFGCSFTYFYWPTHADLLGEQFDELHNWGLSGLGNRAICERLSECIMHNQFTANDVIIVQWTDFIYDWHDLIRLESFVIEDWWKHLEQTC